MLTLLISHEPFPRTPTHNSCMVLDIIIVISGSALERRGKGIKHRLTNISKKFQSVEPEEANRTRAEQLLALTYGERKNTISRVLLKQALS
ncbi:hypothetical protein SDJN03_09231, partial [Cucurbita argyrosperma subsp. sororia]